MNIVVEEYKIQLLEICAEKTRVYNRLQQVQKEYHELSNIVCAVNDIIEALENFDKVMGR
jgi:hypothetical protein